MQSSDKPPLGEVYLAHFGVRGMRWGVHKKDKPGGDNPRSEAESKAAFQGVAAKTSARKLPPKEAARVLKENHDKFQAKFERSGTAKGDSPKGLSDEQKRRLKTAAIGAVAVTGVLAVGYLVVKGRVGKASNIDPLTKMREMAGKPIGPDKFVDNTRHSIGKTWYGNGGYIQPSSFERGEIKLPAGHQFHRISLRNETGFGNHTYATHSLEDFNRYNASFIGDRKSYSEHMHHVTFTTKEEFRVPTLGKVLENVKHVMREGGLPNTTDEEALLHYQSISGGPWNSPVATGLFARLKSQGYHGIVDEMDAGVQGESPLVIFAHEHLSPKSASVITNSMLKKSQDAVIELTNRKV